MNDFYTLILQCTQITQASLQ